MNPYDQAIDWLYTDKTDFETDGPICGDMRKFVKNGLDSVIFGTQTNNTQFKTSQQNRFLLLLFALSSRYAGLSERKCLGASQKQCEQRAYYDLITIVYFMEEGETYVPLEKCEKLFQNARRMRGLEKWTPASPI